MKTIAGEVVDANRPMLKLARAPGFRIDPHPEDEHVRWVSRAL